MESLKRFPKGCRKTNTKIMATASFYEYTF